MNQAVDEGDGAPGVGEDGRPVGEGEIRGQDETLPFIPAADDLEEEIGRAGVVGEIPELVEDQEPTLAVVVQPAGQTARRVLAAEVEQELGGGGEEDVMPGEHRLVGDVLGDHRLPQPLGRDEDQIAGVGEKLQPERGLDGGPVDALRPRPVKRAHRGEAAEAAAEQAPFEAAPGPFLLFVGDEVFEQLGWTPAPLGGERHEVVEVGGRVVQAQGLEGVRQGWHRGPPAPG